MPRPDARQAQRRRRVDELIADPEPLVAQFKAGITDFRDNRERQPLSWHATCVAEVAPSAGDRWTLVCECGAADCRGWVELDNACGVRRSGREIARLRYGRRRTCSEKGRSGCSTTLETS
jgi:hypothetical protein